MICLMLPRADIGRNRPGANDVSLSEAVFLMLLSAAALWYWQHDHDSWKYSWIGDEVSFFKFAQNLSSCPVRHWDFFRGDGVYGDNPVMVSIIQSLGMKLYGCSSFGWRLSCGLSLAVCIPFLFVILKQRTSGFIAAAVCCTFVSSLLVTAWAVIGKPHAFILPPVILSLAFYERSRRPSWSSAFLAGFAAGSGFFLLILGAFAATASLAGAILLDLRNRTTRRQVITGAGWALLGWLVTAIPILVQTKLLSHLYQKNIALPGMAIETMAFNSFHTAISFLYFESSNHFLFGNLTGSLSAVLISVGFVSALARRKWLDLTIFIAGVAFSGTIAYYDYPPLTRLLLVIPAWCIFLGYGLEFFVDRISRPVLGILGVSLVTLVIMVSDVQQWQSDAERWIGPHQYVVRIAQLNPRAIVIAVVPEQVNRENEEIAFAYTGVRNVRFVPNTQAAEALLVAPLNQPITVMIHPDAMVTEQFVRLLIDRHLPVLELRHDLVANLGMVGEVPGLERFERINDAFRLKRKP